MSRTSSPGWSNGLKELSTNEIRVTVIICCRMSIITNNKPECIKAVRLIKEKRIRIKLGYNGLVDAKSKRSQKSMIQKGMNK